MGVLELLLVPRSEWCGWYGAPAPFGRTEFTLTLTEIDYDDGSIKGSGVDKRGEFEITGKVSPVTAATTSVATEEDEGERESCDESATFIFHVEFEKSYIDRSKGTGIYYTGELRKESSVETGGGRVIMCGKYNYLYQMGFFKMNVSDEFEMVLQN